MLYSDVYRNAQVIMCFWLDEGWFTIFSLCKWIDHDLWSLNPLNLTWLNILWVLRIKKKECSVVLRLTSPPLSHLNLSIILSFLTNSCLTLSLFSSLSLCGRRPQSSHSAAAPVPVSRQKHVPDMEPVGDPFSLTNVLLGQPGEIMLQWFFSGLHSHLEVCACVRACVRASQHAVCSICCPMWIFWSPSHFVHGSCLTGGLVQCGVNTW